MSQAPQEERGRADDPAQTDDPTWEQIVQPGQEPDGSDGEDDERARGAHVDPSAAPPEVADDVRPDEQVGDRPVEPAAAASPARDPDVSAAAAPDPAANQPRADQPPGDQPPGDQPPGDQGAWPKQGRDHDERWHELQSRFVDDPVAAVQEAAGLLDEALDDLRRSIPQDSDGGSTEQLRLAFQRYRDAYQSLGAG